MRKTIIKDVRTFLQKNTRTFFNECEFQVYLAKYLDATKRYEEVLLEYLVDFKGTTDSRIPEHLRKRHYVDIVVKTKGGKYYPIELKYKLKAKGLNIAPAFDDEKYPRDVELAGEHTGNCYHSWRDIERVALFAEIFTNVERGLAIKLTNDAQFWSLPKNLNDETISYGDFSLKHERVVNKKVLSWKCAKGTNKLPALSKDTLNDITLLHDYELMWEDTGKDGFKYLIV